LEPATVMMTVLMSLVSEMAMWSEHLKEMMMDLRWAPEKAAWLSDWL